MTKESKETLKNQIIIYQTEDGKTKVEVAFDGDTVWLTQEKMGELFQRDRTTINEHLKNLFEDEELVEDEVMIKVGNSHFNPNNKKPTQFYNLDAILAVGYKVKSKRGIHFRKWASSVLKEYMKKGFAMNDELLKNSGGGTYFKELLERIRDIRSSEKVFYRQVLDLFSTSVDYDKNSEIAIKFFKKMQNQLLFSVSRKTAAELITERANADLPFMGLTAFKGNKPQKSEVSISKNYLKEDEIVQLNLMVSAYLDIAELIALEGRLMYMKDWANELERFIVYRQKPVLSSSGKIDHKKAVEIAENEYEKYKEKNRNELTQVEKDFLEIIHKTYDLLENKKFNDNIKNDDKKK